MSNFVKELILKSGNVFKNIVGEIIRECQNKNIELSADVIAYSVILYFIDPDCGVTDRNNISRTDIDKFVENCVSRLSDTNSPYIKSFQLQYICLDIPPEIVLLNETNIFSEPVTEKEAKLIKDITQTGVGTVDSADIYKKIVFDLIISNRLGKPDNPQTIIEVRNALLSVLSPEEFHEFLLMTQSKRIKKLTNLRLIVCGIMLYNHSEGEVGENMIDIIQDVVTVYKKIKTAIIEGCNSSSKNLRHFQQTRKNFFVVDVETNEVRYLHENLSEINRLTGIMQLYNQYSSYLNQLLNIILKTRKSMNDLIQNWHELIKQIKKLVIYRIPVTCDIIFPLFIELGFVWHNLWNYLRTLINIKKLMDEMSAIFVTDIYSDIIAVFGYALNSKKDKQITQYIKKAPFQFPDDCEWIYYDPEAEIAKNLPKVHGYCSYLLTCLNGVLIPSNLNIGLLKYNDNYYAFSDVRFFKPFTKNPQYFENRFMSVIRSNPHLIIFFDMYNIIQNYKFIDIGIDEERKSRQEVNIEERRKSIDIQTELHPIPFYKPLKYKWNVWDLRRDAVQLANIKNCVTHSCQTDSTYYRNSTKLQTSQLKQDEVQTKKDTSVDTQTDF